MIRKVVPVDLRRSTHVPTYTFSYSSLQILCLFSTNHILKVLKWLLVQQKCLIEIITKSAGGRKMGYECSEIVLQHCILSNVYDIWNQGTDMKMQNEQSYIVHSYKISGFLDWNITITRTLQSQKL